jgi:hypothetical protein
MILRSKEGSSVDFGEIARQLEQGDMTPREVSQARSLLAAYLSRMRWYYGVLAAKRAKYVTEKKGLYKSIAETERVWEATSDGQLELRLESMIRALEVMQGALETAWFMLQGEAKSRY